MRSKLAQRTLGPTCYVDANPLSDRHLTGIGRYTARLALALASHAPIRFFSFGGEVFPSADLNWSQDQDLALWGRQVWASPKGPRAPVPRDGIGIFTCLRPPERHFPFEVSILHDFTPLTVPHTHSEQTRHMFQGFFCKNLLSSDLALAVSHSTKADASWLTAYDPDRIVVAPSGPSLCVGQHAHPGPVQRDPKVGLVVSTIEPRKNAFFLLDWFRDTKALPDDAELWWVGSLGWLTSKRQLRDYRKLPGQRRVRFLGVVSDAALCRLYQTAGWSIYPSLYEGFGFPPLDALRHGTPVLSSYNSALREFQCAGIYFFDPYDPATVDRAWEEFREVGPAVAPRAELAHHYSWDRVARTLLDACAALPREAGRPSANAA